MDTAELPVHVDAWRTSVSWFKVEAARAFAAGHYRLITGRNDRDLYLARFWISRPVKTDDGDFESGDSVMLHWFIRGDDDACLHDHPWDFRTTVLTGRYVEHLPPEGWPAPAVGGPPWDGRKLSRREGANLIHQAEDLHCVGYVEPDTWTLMRTAPRRREWGFHPPGQLWIPNGEYLAQKSSPPLAAAS